MNEKEILSAFQRQYGHLTKCGLTIVGVTDKGSGKPVISLTTPFIFDHRRIPRSFRGATLSVGFQESDLPKEFQVSDISREYIWAYQRFEKFVDDNQELIRTTLKKPEMTRGEMLDAICHGDFEKHKLQCIHWEEVGKIPKWTDKQD